MPKWVGVEDALQSFGGCFNQPIGRQMKKVIASLITGVFAASVFAASPTPAPTTTTAAPAAAAAAADVKSAVADKKHKATKDAKEKISGAAQAPAAAVK
jgi:hypothetical protein